MSPGFVREPWQGRIDSEEGGFAQRWHQAIGPVPDEPGATVLLGFACDAGVVRNRGRAGAAEGPAAARRALANMPLCRPQRLADAGAVGCVGDALEDAQDVYAERVSALLRAGHRVIGLGGGHEIAFAGFCGLLASRTESVVGKVGAGGTAPEPAPEPARQRLLPRIGIVNFDAHFDLRADARGNSGTPFRQIAELCAERGCAFNYLPLGISRFANTAALFERARSLGVHWREDEAMSLRDLDAARGELDAFIDGVDLVYLTICLDVLPPDLAPGVSAPSARGVELAVIEPLIDAVAASGKLAYADIAELNPLLDIDQRTARIAARLVARIAQGWVS